MLLSEMVPEIFPETQQFAMLQVLVKKGKTVILRHHEYTRSFTRWCEGPILDVVHATGPDTDNFLVWYDYKVGDTTRKTSVRIGRAQFEKMHLHRIGDQWYLSDSLPREDDET